MKKIYLIIAATIIFYNLCYSQNSTSSTLKDIAYYDSLCPGFETRYNTIRDIKRSTTYTNEESIHILKDVLLQTEVQDGLFDDINYLEAIRLLCYKYLQMGDYFRIDSVLYTTQRYINENIANPSEFQGLYKFNRIASWLEFKNGRYESAIELLKNCIEKEVDSVEYLSVIQELALCYLMINRYGEFSAIAKKAVEIADTITTNDYTFQLKLQSEKLKAFICMVSDNDIKKGTELLESLALNLKGKKNWMRFYCSVLNDLSYIYMSTDVNKYIKTKDYILNCGILSDEEKVQILESLVGAEWLYAKDEIIINHAIQHSNILKDIAVKNLTSFSPTQNIAKWPEILERLDKDTYILERFSDHREICELCYNNQLFLKNLIFSSDYAIRNYCNNWGDKTIRKQLAEIDSLRETIVYKGVDKKDIESYSYELSYHESDLMKLLPMVKIIKDQLKTWKDVASSLNEDEIAVEIADCPVLFPKDSIYSQMMALIVTKNCDSPKCIKLGNLYEIANELRMIFSKDPLEIDRVYSTRNNSIYRLIWGNLKKHLNGVKTIYISSNTFLQFVNTGALLSSDGIRASDEWTIKLLTSTSEIPSIKNNIIYSSLSLFGASNFNVKDHEEDDLYTDVIRSLNNRGDFQELKGTIEEVNKIQHEIENPLLKIQKFIGNQATESNFRLLNGNSSQIIHIATHCFAIPDIKNCKYLSRLMAIDKRDGGMLGTGFILSNANSSWNGSDKKDSKNDGILLSEDISKLNLSGCDLVVLSGCQSGVGQMEKDGIYGLQRAFKRAGVQSMLLSLWNVDDNVTKEFMITFYKFLFKTGNKYEAYSSAQNELFRKYNNPYYWAAFVMLD